MNKNETRIVLAVIALLALVFSYMYLDEVQDNINEKVCMEQVDKIQVDDGYSPDCDL
jgi:hypothetical protein